MAPRKAPTPAATLDTLDGFVAELLRVAVLLDGPEDAPLRRAIGAVEPTLRRGAVLLRAHLDAIGDAIEGAAHHQAEAAERPHTADQD